MLLRCPDYAEFNLKQIGYFLKWATLNKWTLDVECISYGFNWTVSFHDIVRWAEKKYITDQMDVRGNIHKILDPKLKECVHD